MYGQVVRLVRPIRLVKKEKTHPHEIGILKWAVDSEDEEPLLLFPEQLMTGSRVLAEVSLIFLVKCYSAATVRVGA